MFLEAANQLREATRLGRTFESAQVKVIGLEDIRKAAGATWPMISARIRANSMQFLQGRLQRDDLVIPAGDGFLIIYSEASDRDFESESAALRAALNKFFLGRSQTERLRAHVTHKRVDSGGLMRLMSDPAPPQDAKHELTFMPVWNARQEAVTGYWLAPYYRAGGQRHFGYDQAWAETRIHSEADYLALDLAIAARAAEEAERSLASGRRCLIGYSVHASTMQFRQRRREYLAALYTIEERLRPYLVGKIAEIEPGTPMTSISEWAHQLRPVNGLVALQLHESDRVLAGLNSTGAFSVSFTLQARQHEPAGRASYRRSIARWSQALAKQGLRLRLDNIGDADLLAVAIENQVDFFTSEAMWPPVDGPHGVYLFSKDQFGAMLGAI
jgi:hypothetical protein